MSGITSVQTGSGWDVDQVPSPFESSLPVRYGQAASKCKVPNTLDATKTQGLGQRSHVAFANFVAGAWQIEIPNFYQVVGGNGESGPGAPLYVSAAIEYPKGTTTRVYFSGATVGVCPDLSRLRSDNINLNIPRGARFWVRLFEECSGGLVTSLGVEGQLDTTATGDNTQKGTGALSDTTMTPGAITNTTGAQGIGCCAILSWTAGPAVFAWGDSLVAGTGDSGYSQASLASSESASGSLGYAARALDRQCASIICGAPGETVQNIAAGSASYYANRLALRMYCTHAYSNFASNDLVAGRTAAQITADVNTFAALLLPLPLLYGTVQPMGATSTDGFTTYSGQTAAAYNSVRTTFNDSLRAGKVTGVAAVFDVGAVMEHGRNSGKWITWPTARVLSDAAITSGTAALTSASAAFTKDDVGALAYVAGAGAAGAALVAYIIDVTSATAATLSSNAGTTVTGAALRIGHNAATVDGNHPYLLGPKRVEESNAMNLARCRI